MNTQNIHRRVVQWLGQPAPSDLAAWEGYLKSLRSYVQASWNQTLSAYRTLKQVRDTLGLPFIIDGAAPEGGAPAGMSTSAAWNTDLDQRAADVGGMVTLLTGAIDDVVANKRSLVWNPATNDFGIQALPEDLLRLDTQVNACGEPVPILIGTAAAGASANQPAHITLPGGPGTVGVLPFGLVATAVVAPALALPFIVVRACNNLTTSAEQKTIRTITEKQFACVQSGKSSEECVKVGTSVIQATTELTKAKAELAKAGKPASPTDWGKLVTAGTWLALAVGGIYLLSKVVPRAGSRAPAMASPLALNPRGHREPVDQDAARELEIFIDNDSRFSPLGQGQGRAISQNLWKKWKKGAYDSARAPQAWSYVVESAAKAYARDIGGTSNWSNVFNPATRAAVAQSLAREWEDMAKSGEFDRYSPAA